jgi:hypothetical protein
MKEPLIYLHYLLLSVIKRWPKNPENENKNIKIKTLFVF